MVTTEREAVRKSLQEAFFACASGNASTVIIEGGAGCGKSDILEFFVEYSTTAGATVLRATCSPLEEDKCPFSLLRQLVNSASFPPTLKAELKQSINKKSEVSESWHSDSSVAHRVKSEVLENFKAVLQDTTTSSPIIICVDDIQHLNYSSIVCLLDLVRQSQSTRVLLALTKNFNFPSTDPLSNTELLRQPNLLRIHLDRLGISDAREVLAQNEDIPWSHELADSFYQISGGNPLLLHALIEDRRLSKNTTPESHTVHPVIGGPFSQAILACLRRSGAMMLDLARTLAILGEFSTPDLLSQMLATTTTQAAQGLHILNTAGIIEGYCFRHPVAEAAVLDDMCLHQRTSLHRHAAALLHNTGVSRKAIAHHLLAAQCSTEPWEVATLQEAAEQALIDDQIKQAAAYLKLAYEGCTDEQQRIRIKLGLAAIMWRVNPSIVEQHYLNEPISALQEGKLSSPTIRQLSRLLIAHGRLEEANEALEQTKTSSCERVSRNEIESEISELWSWFAYPTSTISTEVQTATPSSDRDVTNKHSPLNPGIYQATIPWLLANDSKKLSTEAAEQFLRISPLTEMTLIPLVTAVRVLIRADELDKSTFWCNELLDEATRRDLSGWRAIFASIRADISLQQGNLLEVEEHTTTALAAVPDCNGSMFRGGPTATLVLAYTAMGKHDAAARQLNQPLPESLFKSIYGLNYLRARGYHHLALNHAHAALSDFLMVGRLTERWGIDQLAAVTWRTDAAEAWLQLNEYEHVEQAITDQATHSFDSDPRIYGRLLRLQASITTTKQRIPLLKQAVEKLQYSRDRLELARTLTDLGETYRNIGKPTRANAALSRAWNIANDCGAKPLCERIAPGEAVSTPSAGAGRSNNIDIVTKLSDSERRVATLVARGYTNQKVSTKLYITVSTVEQHLTQVYRKLGITSRRELPPDLEFE